MNDASTGALDGAVEAVGSGLPHLLSQFALTLALLVAGVAIYIAVTPFRERALLEKGNAAAGIVLAGAILGLAIPLAALLATTSVLLDILVWGVVAVVLQLAVLTVAGLVFRRLRGMIETGNVAAATVLAATQVAVALLNGAVMVPN